MCDLLAFRKVRIVPKTARVTSVTEAADHTRKLAQKRKPCGAVEGTRRVMGAHYDAGRLRLCMAHRRGYTARPILQTLLAPGLPITTAQVSSPCLQCDP